MHAKDQAQEIAQYQSFIDNEMAELRKEFEKLRKEYKKAMRDLDQERRSPQAPKIVTKAVRKMFRDMGKK